MRFVMIRQQSKSGRRSDEKDTQSARALSDLMSMQEGGLTVSAPAIGLSAPELVIASGIDKAALAWAHSCHTKTPNLYCCCRRSSRNYLPVRRMAVYFGVPLGFLGDAMLPLLELPRERFQGVGGIQISSAKRDRCNCRLALLLQPRWSSGLSQEICDVTR
ncbi:hypothetical protein [Bradyrhizobium sp. BR 1432]|uniref:hypothetical protein n=1 Tax=Bradyrhizobium sp. BR 1432 TaxID=3447966 RepID=UPI003EE4FEBA